MKLTDLFFKIETVFVDRNIYELWGMGKTYEEVHTQVKAEPKRWVNRSICNFIYLFIKTSF